MGFVPFTKNYTVSAHRDFTITAVYTNDIDSVDAWIKNAEGFLAGCDIKIVGVDIEYTKREYKRKRGSVQKAAVIHVCVGNHCLVYHICFAADGIAASFDAFLRNMRYRFAGFDITKDKTMLYRSAEPLFMMNHVDIHAIWSNPDRTSFRNERLMDVAALFVDPSYKDYNGGLTDADHRMWGAEYLSDEHVNYAVKNAFVCSELYKKLHIYERGFFHSLYTKKKDFEKKEWGWGWADEPLEDEKVEDAEEYEWKY